MTNVFLYGRSGTGKTILGAEIVKIKLSQLMANKEDVKVIVAQYHANYSSLLLQNLREKYFKNIDCQVLSLSDLCGQLHIELDWKHSKDTINRVINRIH